MPTQSVTLELPEPLYDRLKRWAEQTRSTVEAEVVDVLVSAMSEYEGLSDDLTETLASLAFLDDGTKIFGGTPTGRATVGALRPNRPPPSTPEPYG